MFQRFWHKCPRCQARMKAENLKNENELQSYFIHRMESILKEKGKKLIGWDEIIDGGLAPDATVMSWRGMEGGIKSAKAGHHVIMTPTEHCYIDLWQGEPSVEPDTYSMCRLKDSYSFNPVPDSVPAEMILGGQGNLWAESVPTFRHAEYMTWPRGWALAEVLWTGPSKTDWTGSGHVSNDISFVQTRHRSTMHAACTMPSSLLTILKMVFWKSNWIANRAILTSTIHSTIRTPTTSLRNMKLRSEYPRMRLGYVLSLIGTTSRLAKL